MTEMTRTPRLRALHAVANAPAVDVHLDRVALITNLGYSEFTDYTAIQPGNHTFEVLPAGRHNGALVTGDLIDVREGQDYTMVVLGKQDMVHAQVMHDSTGAPAADRAKVRFLHGSPDAPAVDVFAGRERLFDNIAFRDETPYVEVPAGITNIEVRASGSNDAVLTLPDFRFAAGNIYSFVAIGLLKGTPALTVIPLTTVVEERVAL